MLRTAIYPGSFDPVTNGHLDIIERGFKLFDKIIVAILHNPAKKYLFSVDERMVLLRESLKKFPEIEIEAFDGLLVDYAVQKNAQAILRGMRAVSDFEYEFQMALMNRKLADDIATILLMPHARYTYLNSTIVRNLAAFHGDVSGFVPTIVEAKLKEKFPKPE